MGAERIHKSSKTMKHGSQGASVGVSGARLFQERVLGPSGDLDFQSFGATWQICAVLYPLDFEAVPKSIIQKNEENEIQEAGWKKTWFVDWFLIPE